MDKIKDIVKSKQYFLIFICFFVYTLSQVGRYTYASNINYVINFYGVSKADAALPSSLFYFGYAGGQIIAGLFCRKFNRKWFISTALLISAICNLLVFVNIPFDAIKYLWLCNGIVQSCLFAIVFLALGEKVDKKYNKQVVLVMSTCGALGGLIIYGAASLFSALKISNYTFLFGAICMLIISVTWFVYCSKKDTALTATLEIPTNEEKYNKETNPYPSKSLAILIPIFCLISACAYAVSGSLKSWAPNIFYDIYHLEDSISIILAFAIPIVSIFNGVVCNWLYKKIKSFNLICVICTVITAIFIVLLILLINVNWIITTILLIVICFTSGIIANVMTVQAPLYLKNKKISSGFLAGILNGGCYLGNALVTFLLGFIVDKRSWSLAFWLLFVICIFSLILNFVLYLCKGKMVKNAEEEFNRK